MGEALGRLGFSEDGHHSSHCSFCGLERRKGISRRTSEGKALITCGQEQRYGEHSTVAGGKSFPQVPAPGV